MHANIFICAAWQVQRITEIVNLEIDVRACWACWCAAVFEVAFVSCCCWGVSSLGSEGSALGPAASSERGKEVAERCVLSFVRTDARRRALRVLLQEAVFATLQKGVFGIWFVSFWFGFFVSFDLFGVFVLLWVFFVLFDFQKLSVLWNSLWNDLEKDRFFAVSSFHPKFSMRVQIIYEVSQQSRETGLYCPCIYRLGKSARKGSLGCQADVSLAALKNMVLPWCFVFHLIFAAQNLLCEASNNVRRNSYA